MKSQTLHGENVLLPSTEEWRVALTSGVLEGTSIPDAKLIASWLSECGALVEAILGVRKLRGKWWLLPLLHTGGHFYRVHFENVICEHCNHRCGMSARPDHPQYADTGLTAAQVTAEFASLGVQACPHCGGKLNRRQTVWLASRGGGGA